MSNLAPAGPDGSALAVTTGNFTDYLLSEGRDAEAAVVDAAGSHTYRELCDAAARVAGELAARDLPAGTRVAVVGGNSLFWVASYLAVMKLGLVVVPLATALKPADVTRYLDWVDAPLVLGERRARRLLSGVDRDVVDVIDETVLASDGPSSWPDLPILDPDSDAALMFTSGTTSTPKAVRVSHRNLIANTGSIVDYLELRRDDRILVVLPFFYCYGASLLHTHLRVGAAVVVCNTFAFPETAVDLMERECCTGFAGVPSSYERLLHASSFRDRELPDLRLMQQAGGRMPPAMIEQVAAAKPEARLFVMYGQTEATSRLSYLPPEQIGRRTGSIGRGIPGVDLRVVADDGHEVSPGETGEIRARGASITRGYWNDPQGTAAKFVSGELRTGDLARVDEHGYIYVVGRRGDFIKSWGFRVSSQEVEACAAEVPGVVNAAAVGVPDEQAGEAIVLFCTTVPGADVSEAEVLTACRKGLAKYMVPQEIRFLAEMPLNRNGKIDKAALRASGTPGEWVAETGTDEGMGER